VTNAEDILIIRDVLFVSGGLKVNECDFCESKSEHLYPINDGLWAICKACYDLEYGECHPPEYCVYKSCECEEE
jgi:hypothetical protein